MKKLLKKFKAQPPWRKFWILFTGWFLLCLPAIPLAIYSGRRILQEELSDIQFSLFGICLAAAYAALVAGVGAGVEVIAERIKNRKCKNNVMMKVLIFTITILFTLPACSSLESNRLAEAETLYQKGEYSPARDICEEILVKDPYNKEATDLLTRVYRKLHPDTSGKIDKRSQLTPYPVLKGVSPCRGVPLDTIDDTWLIEYFKERKRERQ